jgi:hypothetical protein
MKFMKWTLSAFAFFAFSLPCVAQETADKTPKSSTEETNIRAYIELLRADVRAKKTAVMGHAMELTDQQGSKFWPIYREYDVALQRLNDQKLAAIKEYADHYDGMTDKKADELAERALQLEIQRNEIKKTYYEKIRGQLGGVVAARFLQIENQMLLVIDLQIASSLPLVINSTTESK